MSQQLGLSSEERPTSLISLPTPIETSETVLFVASHPSRRMRLKDLVHAATTPRWVLIGVALAVATLLVARGIEIRITEIIIHFGR